MKRFAKIALGAVMLAGAATVIASPASAGIAVGIGVGPGYYGPPAGAVCDPYSRFYNPAYCAPAGYGYGYNDYGPIIGFGGFYGSGWHGGYHSGGFHGGNFHGGGGFHGGHGGHR